LIAPVLFSRREGKDTATAWQAKALNRPSALGWQNRLFAGSLRAGKRVRF